MSSGYLVFDFETTGVGKDAMNGYRPYPSESRPLPRPNFPTELAYTVVDNNGVVLESSESILISGAQRLDPFVLKNCPHLSIQACERDGVEFAEALRRLAHAAKGYTLVAHNIDYDWNEVIVATAREQGLESLDSFLTLKSCPRFCTCINEFTKADKTAYYFQKIGKWVGPKLSALAAAHCVEYDTEHAHAAAYDVHVTVACLRKLKSLA